MFLDFKPPPPPACFSPFGHLEEPCRHCETNEVALLKVPFNTPAGFSRKSFAPDTSGHYDCSFLPSTNSRHKNELPCLEGKYGKNQKNKTEQEKEQVSTQLGRLIC